MRGALRAAASDFYFNSWRLVPANIVWGLAAGLVYLVALVAWPLSLVLLPFLAFPTAGIFRIAALAVRGESVSFWDGVRVWRRQVGAILFTGIAVTAYVLVILANLVGGVQSGDLLGLAFATLAGWGLVVGVLWLLCFWPLLVDPRREGWGLRGAARAAGYLVVAYPVRFGLLGLVIGGIIAVSTVLFAALVTVSVAFGALVACRYVLPAADRLEARMAEAGVMLGPTPVQPDPAAEAGETTTRAARTA